MKCDRCIPSRQCLNRIAPFIVGTGIERSTACGKSAEAMRLTTPAERKSWRAA